MSVMRMLCLLLFSQILTAGSGEAGEAHIKAITVTHGRDNLLLHLEVENAFSEKTVEAIKNGIPASFAIFVDLYRVRNMWFDKKISSLKMIHIIKYDTLKKRFMVTRSWADPQFVIADTLDEAKGLMARIESLRVIGLEGMTEGRRYRIRAKARLERLSLPGYRKYCLFFRPGSEFKTDWGAVEFTF